MIQHWLGFLQTPYIKYYLNRSAVNTKTSYDIPPTPFRIIFLYCSSPNVRLWLNLIYKSREFLSTLTNLANLSNFNSCLLCILRLFCVYNREITSSTLSKNDTWVHWSYYWSYKLYFKNTGRKPREYSLRNMTISKIWSSRYYSKKFNCF